MAAYMRKSCRPLAVTCRNTAFMSHIIRMVSTKGKKSNKLRDLPSYKELISFRRAQSDRSLLVSVVGHHGDLYKTCQRHGRVSALFPFSHNERDYVLVEMESRLGLESVLNTVEQFPNRDRIPVTTRFVYMQMGQRQSSLVQCPPSILHKTRPPLDPDSLLASLSKSKSVSDQMVRLQRAMSMSELATRLRFLLCSSLEETLRGTLPTCVVKPFGSSVNGFGKHDCDLDIILEMDEENQMVNGRLRKEGLYFMSKKKQDNNRLQTQMTLDTIGGVISHFTPQFGYVRRILKARIPIIKFVHRGTGIECDLSIGNRSAVYMSELLHLYGQLDARVRPLVYAVRSWARVQDVTRSDPGPWMSNFMLTWMVIYYLQTRDPPVVPSIGQLRNMAGPEDKKVLNGEDMTFVTDPSHLPLSENSQPLDKLLQGFFQFYADIDFTRDALSLVEGRTFPKPDQEVPLHLENPLERDLNASRNVSADELVKFQTCCSRAADALQSSSRSRSTGSHDTWGLLSILIDNEETIDNEPNLNVSMAGLFLTEARKGGTGGESSEQARPRDSLGSEAKPMSSSDDVVSTGSCSDDVDISAPLTGTYKETLDRLEHESDSNDKEQGDFLEPRDVGTTNR